MEPAGLALGVIGLAGILKSRVELFGYFSSYRSYGHDHNLLDAKLHIEKAVLLQWADRVRLLYEDYDRRLDNTTTREAVSRIFTSVIHLLSETSSLQQQYDVEQVDEPRAQLLVSQSPATGRSLMERFRDDYNAMQVRLQQRKATASASSKVKWIIMDKDKFKNLIEDLSHFTSELEVLLPTDSTERAVSLLASQTKHDLASIYKENAKEFLQQATYDHLETNAILSEAREQ